MTAAIGTRLSDPRPRRSHALFAVLAILLTLITVARAHQQPRVTVSLAGSWALDPYVSDHPQQLAGALRFLTAEPRADAESLTGRAGADRRDGGRGDRGGAGRSGGVPWEPLDEGDRRLLTELTDAVRFPPPNLTISQTEGAVTVVTDSGRTVTMQTNGKAEKHTLKSGAVERTARWEGPQLLVSYDVGRAGTLNYIYLRAPTTGQLVIRVDFARRRGDASVFDVRLVYDPAVSPGVTR